MIRLSTYIIVSVALAATVLSHASNCYAVEGVEAQPMVSELSIVDSAGNAQASGFIEAQSDVTFSVLDATGAAAQNAEVTLTNTVTGQTITTSAVNGTASFQGVTAGSWTLASTTPGVVVANVEIASAILPAAGLGLGGGLTAATATAAAGGTAAVAAGTVAAVDAADSNNNDNDQELSPST
jgi:hypothetical protein